MTSVTLLRHDREWTVEDLRGLPDDGLQYELADGVLLVSPSPRPAHRRAVGRFFLELSATCPPELEVFTAPLDFQPTPRRSLQPDLLVVRKADVEQLAIERLLQVSRSAHKRVPPGDARIVGTDQIRETSSYGRRLCDRT